MSSQTPLADFKRITTFDLLRIFFVVSIVMLHTWEHFVGEDFPSFPPSFSFYEIYRQVVGTVLNYAALYVLSLSFFIWGLKGLKIQWPKLLIFFLGFTGLQLKDSENPFVLDSWSWDVYGYLFIAVFFCRFWPKKLTASVGLFIASLIMLSLPLSTWEPIASQTVQPWRTILFADINGQSMGGWFLIPWFFISTLSYSVGLLLALRKDIFRWVHEKSLLLMVLFSIGSLICFFIKTPPLVPMLGDRFYQFLFMQSPAHFWNHFLAFSAVIVFCLRVENTEIVKNSSLKYLSHLQWNRNFFLCYFFHFSLIVFFLNWKDQILEIPYGIDILWLVILLGTESIIQFFVRALKVYQRIAIWLFKRFQKPAH